MVAVGQGLLEREYILREIFIEFAPDYRSPRNSNIYAYSKVFFKIVVASLIRRGFMREEILDENNSFYYFTNLGRRFFSVFRLLEILSSTRPKTRLNLSTKEIILLRYFLISKELNKKRRPSRESSMKRHDYGLSDTGVGKENKYSIIERLNIL